MNADTSTRRNPPGEARIALFGLLAIQIVVGYEWLMSGMTKFVRGGFPSGLAAELTDKSKGVTGWYKSFLDGTVIPHAKLFGWLIESSEVLIGVALIAAAVTWLARRDHLSRRGWTAVLGVTIAACLGGIVMAVSFHTASGASHPWLIPKSGFDEGIDLDSLLPMLQAVLALVSGKLLLGLRRSPGTRAIADTSHAAPGSDPAGH